MNKSIGVFVGSLRKDSNSKKIAKLVIDLLPSGYDGSIIKIDRLQFYNQDFDDDNKLPYSFIAFRKVIEDLDGFIFVTPEYNRSIPALLKNALDVASRPAGFNKWSGKPAGIISSSKGLIGGFGANHHLRQCLTFLNVPTMQQPEAYITGLMPGSFDASGRFVEEGKQQLLEKFVKAYVDWFDQLIK